MAVIPAVDRTRRGPCRRHGPSPASPSPGEMSRRSAAPSSTTPSSESSWNASIGEIELAFLAAGCRGSSMASPPSGLPMPRRPCHRLRGELLARMGILPLPLSSSCSFASGLRRFVHAHGRQPWLRAPAPPLHPCTDAHPPPHTSRSRPRCTHSCT